MQETKEKQQEPTKLVFKKLDKNRPKTFYSPILEKTILIPQNDSKYLGSVCKNSNGKWKVKIEVSEKSHYVPYAITIVKCNFEDEESAKKFQKKMCLYHGLLKNLMILRGDYFEMALTNQGYTKVDLNDFHLVDKYMWMGTSTNGGIYVRRVSTEKEDRSRYALHNEVMKFTPNKDGTGDTIDHVNRDTLDNRKANLRIASKKEQGNNKVTPAGKSGLQNIMLGKKGNTQYFELRLSVDGNRRRAYFFFSEYGGAQGAKDEAIRVRDICKRVIKQNLEIKNKLVKKEITLKDVAK
jgi:hypothetical protein